MGGARKTILKRHMSGCKTKSTTKDDQSDLRCGGRGDGKRTLRMIQYSQYFMSASTIVYSAVTSDGEAGARERVDSPVGISVSRN